MIPQSVRSDRLVERWRCHKRGRCCRDWSITVTETEWTRIRTRLERIGDPRATVFTDRSTRSKAGFRIIPSDDDFRCAFLTDTDLCDHRMTHGEGALPGCCAKFPFIIVMTPARFLVAISFACPTALGLLAGQTELEPYEVPDGMLPADTFLNASGPSSQYRRLDGTLWDAAGFWEAVDAARGTLSGRTADEGLLELSRRWLDWAPDSRDGAAWTAARTLLDDFSGESPTHALLDQIWSTTAGGSHDATDLPPCPGADELLRRLLAHRLAVPAWLTPHWSPDRLVTGLWAMALRFRLERLRGADAYTALWRVDRLVSHGSFIADLLHESTAALSELAHATLLAGEQR